MNINQNSNCLENKTEFCVPFSYSLNVIEVPCCIIKNTVHSLFNSTCNIAKTSISLGQRTVQMIRNPFLFSQIGNIKKISFIDIHNGMRLLQTYLQFRFSKKQHLAGEEIKKKLVDQIQKKCSMEWGTQWIKKITTADWNGTNDEWQEYAKMAEDHNFQEVLALAANPKWGMLVKHAELGIHLVAPLEWQICIHTFSDFINKAVRNRIDEASVTLLINTIVNVIVNYRPSDNLEFILTEFPEIDKVLKLILENPKNITLLIPLLLGSKQIPSSICALQLNSFSQYIQENRLQVESKENLQKNFVAWLRQKPEIVNPRLQTKEVISSTKLIRFESGRKKLESIHQDLLHKNKMLQIGIILEYDQDQTTFIWLKRVLTEKLEALEDKYGNLTQLKWKISLVDARKNGNQELINEINHYLSQCSLKYNRITFQHLTGQKIEGKAEAVKFGLNKMCTDSDILGFIDLSDKINILEIGHFIASIYEDCNAGNEGIAIGSRRMATSQVDNKAFTFLLRSTGLNWIVKVIFPLLSQITDTQTGFKFFSKKAWLNIQKSGLSCKSLAFDIEILQQAARLGLEIKQFPVDFHDNTQDREGEIEGDKITEMVKELLTIRSNRADSSLNQFEKGEGRLLAGGAEHMVFSLEDGSLVKIPHEQFDPHLFGLLKHVVFKNKGKMNVEDQDKKLISSDCISSILDHPKLSQYIPLLRGYKDFNIFVMKIIANIEKKSYQSLGYEISEKLGRDLVIPFCFIDKPFSLKLDGQWRSFSSSDQVKRMVSAQIVVKDQVTKILADGCLSDELKEAKILLLIDEAMDLFQSLWKRGIFDLDANIMSDMGYYPNTWGQNCLMVLDPGEILDDPSKINPTLLRQQIAQRYDFKELKILLKQLGKRGDAILQHYQLKMTRFVDLIEGDLKKDKDLQIFGEDQKKERCDFSLIMPCLASLPEVQATLIDQNKTIECFQRSKNGFHVPYSRGIPPINSHAIPTYPFICCVPYSVSTPPRSSSEKVVLTGKGSIGPTFQTLDQYDPDWSNPKAPSTLVILDAGSATRSSLMKYATERGTKGDLQLGGKPIYEHIAANFSELLSSYLPEGYLLMASSDDLIHFSKVDCQAIHDYFHPTKDRKAPGFFWTEIPNSYEKYLPHTVLDTVRMIQEPAIVELSGTILKQIPIFKSAVQAGQIKPIIQNLSNTLEKIAPFILEKTSQILSKVSVEEGLIPGYATITDLYQQLLLYQAAERLNGLKTPFFMIFKKEFLADFKQVILPLLPSSIYLDITWESILIRGIKMDKTIWMHSGRPSAISSKEWVNIWEGIQALKVQHHIDINCPSQGSLRSAKLKWQNFDDPYSLFLFAKKTYQFRKKRVWNENKVKIISDQRRRDHQGNIQSKLKGTVVLLNSKIEGKIVIETNKKTESKNKHFESLFYHVMLPAHSTLHVPPNHLVVGIKGRIFSIKMGMISKEKLKASSVYLYDSEGHPFFFSSFAEFSNTS